MAFTITTSPAKGPLSDRSTNTRLPSLTPMETAKEAGDNATELKAATVQSMEYHRQVLKERLEEGKMQCVLIHPVFGYFGCYFEV